MFENMIQEAVVYCRVSSQVQQERETIESQVEFAKKFCDLLEEQANKDVSIDIVNAVDALTELQNVVRDADFETKRTVIETMIDSITVKTLHPGQWRSEAIVTIHFRFADIGHDDTTAIKNRRGKRVIGNDGMFDVSFSVECFLEHIKICTGKKSPFLPS